MRFLGKKEWIEKHGTMRRYGSASDPQYTDAHTKLWASIGWTWTPAMCLCQVPCYLMTDDDTMKGMT